MFLQDQLFPCDPGQEPPVAPHEQNKACAAEMQNSSAATPRGWGQREHLPALPGLHSSWTQPGSHSSTVSGRSSSCLGASHHTPRQQPERSAPLPALGIHTTEGSWDLKKFRISLWDLSPPKMYKLSSCWSEMSDRMNLGRGKGGTDP